MPNEIPDMETYAATLQQVMAEAIAQAEALKAEAEADREAALADRDKMNDLLRIWEHKAQSEVEVNVPALRREVETDIVATITAKLKNSGKPDAEVERLLKIITNP